MGCFYQYQELSDKFFNYVVILTCRDMYFLLLSNSIKIPFLYSSTI